MELRNSLSDWYNGRTREEGDMVRSYGPDRFSVEDWRSVLKDLYPFFMQGGPLPPYIKREEIAYQIVKKCRESLENHLTEIKAVDPDEQDPCTLKVSPMTSLVYLMPDGGYYPPLLTGDIAKVIPLDIWGDPIKESSRNMEIEVYEEPGFSDEGMRGVRLYMNVYTMKHLFSRYDQGGITEGKDAVLDYNRNEIKVGEVGYFPMRLKRRLPPTGRPMEHEIEIPTRPKFDDWPEEVKELVCKRENSEGETWYGIRRNDQFFFKPNPTEEQKERIIFEWDVPKHLEVVDREPDGEKKRFIHTRKKSE